MHVEGHRCDPELVVLHALRCGGASSTERLGDAVGVLIDSDVEDVLLGLATQGLVTHDRGRFGGWRLTDTGRAADANRIAAELEQTGTRPDVEAAYHDFLSLNERMLNVCTDWQLRSRHPMIVNDHTDKKYDLGVFARLAALNALAQPICERLATRLTRFSRYGPRLESAVLRVRHGEIDQVADSVDSYHSVWFQLHEDLLTTLGLSRQT